MVRQGSAKPCTPVRFRVPPLGEAAHVRAISSGGERFLDAEEVSGSNPLSPTTLRDLLRHASSNYLVIFPRFLPLTKKGAYMASVKLPDGKQLEIEPGERALDVAEKIGKRLAKDAVVAKLDGELIDLEAPLNGGGDFEVVTKESSEGLEVLRHSTAHAMAQAITELYPGS